MEEHYPFEWSGRMPPDALEMDEFAIVSPMSGKTITPHVGETVWCHIYGGPMSHALTTVGAAIEEFQAAVAADDMALMDAAGVKMARVICDRVIHWTLTNPETGAPYPQPSAGPDEVYAALPSPLLLWLFQRVAGIETAADRGNGSRALPSGPSATKVPKPRRRSK